MLMSVCQLMSVCVWDLPFYFHRVEVSMSKVSGIKRHYFGYINHYACTYGLFSVLSMWWMKVECSQNLTSQNCHVFGQSFGGGDGRVVLSSSCHSNFAHSQEFGDSDFKHSLFIGWCGLNETNCEETNSCCEEYLYPPDPEKCETVTQPPPCEPTEEQLEWCDQLFLPIFEPCWDYVDPCDFFDTCTVDICVSNQTESCWSLEAYALQCTTKGICLEWRNETFCSKH